MDGYDLVFRSTCCFSRANAMKLHFMVAVSPVDSLAGMVGAEVCVVGLDVAQCANVCRFRSVAMTFVFFKCCSRVSARLLSRLIISSFSFKNLSKSAICVSYFVFPIFIS